MRVLLTGSAGFIGFHLAKRLLEDGHAVTGFDAFTPYYDVTLKHRRHAILERHREFKPWVARLEDMDALNRAADFAKPDAIIHLAAQAGVRHSIENPKAYFDANLVGSWHILELAKRIKPRHLLLASTSSVYGASRDIPFRESDPCDKPLSFYAATKRAMEVLAHAYAHIERIPTTILRFFTVYGPWGRPDMALFRFTDAILNDRPVEIYGDGAMRRDFTFVDDAVEAVVRLLDLPPVAGRPVARNDTLSPDAPYRVVNIAGGRPVGLLDFVGVVEQALGRTARRESLPMQPGDMPVTCADTSLLEALTGFRPNITVEDGVRAFVDWYRADMVKSPAG